MSDAVHGLIVPPGPDAGIKTPRPNTIDNV